MRTGYQILVHAELRISSFSRGNQQMQVYGVGADPHQVLGAVASIRHCLMHRPQMIALYVCILTSAFSPPDQNRLRSLFLHSTRAVRRKKKHKPCRGHQERRSCYLCGPVMVKSGTTRDFQLVLSQSYSCSLLSCICRFVLQPSSMRPHSQMCAPPSFHTSSATTKPATASAHCPGAAQAALPAAEPG